MDWIELSSRWADLPITGDHNTDRRKVLGIRANCCRQAREELCVLASASVNRGCVQVLVGVRLCCSGSASRSKVVWYGLSSEQEIDVRADEVACGHLRVSARRSSLACSGIMTSLVEFLREINGVCNLHVAREMCPRGLVVRIMG